MGRNPVKQYPDVVLVELINKSHRLNAIIDDLTKAAENFPKEELILQTLGDAYLKNNQLQEAIETFTQLENLIY